MQLKKQPKTEMEYWEIIEGLGGFAWRMNHDLGDERITDPTGEIDQEILEARKISDKLVNDLDEKFGVIAPKNYPKVEIGQTLPTTPEGKIYYWDWYKKMQKEYYELEYEKIICSACPFSEGVEKMNALGGTIPCSVFPGMVYRLYPPYACAMIDFSSSNYWTEEQLYQEIIKKGGKKALQVFEKKLVELKVNCWFEKQFNETN